jgi:transglycosylase-like protein with SLT domain
VVLIDRDIAVEQFDYWRVAGDLAILRLLTSLGTSCGGPAAAELVVDPGPDGDEPFCASACGGTLERRLMSGRSPGSQLLWQARFAVPLRVLEAPQARFRLTAGAESELTLPAPWLRDITPRALALTRFEDRRRAVPRIAVTNPRQLAALASAAVIGGTSAPATALAAGIAAPGGPTGVSRAAGVGKSAFAMDPPQTGRRHRGPAPTPPTFAMSAPETSTTTTTTPMPTTTTTVTTPTTTTTTVTTPTTTTTTVITPTTTTVTTTPRSQRPTGSTPNCQSPSGGHLLTITPAFVSRRAKAAVGLSIDPKSARCNPTTAPKAGHTHPTKGHPKAGTHRHKGTRPRAGSHPGAQHPHSPKQVTGGAPLSPGQPKQPDNTLAPTPSSSSPPSGGAAETPVPTLSSSPSFVNPGSWTGTVTADPSLTGAVRNLAGLLANGNRPPSFLIPIYMQAGKRYGIPWPVLAAINAVESDYGRNLSTSSAGAVGWMQFMPSTWAQYGVSADGLHKPNPFDPRDAIFAAARYLKAAGGSQNISRAVFAYNHASWYVDMVMSRARAITHQAQYVQAKLSQRGTYSVFFATGLKKHPTVRYSGGVLSHYTRLIAAANMVSAANFNYLYGGGHEQPARWGPFDCSGSVSYVMQQAGYKVPTTVSGDIPSWKFPAGPGAVTIFYNPVHTFMRIGNRYFGTSGFARPGGGAGWFNVNKLPASYLSTFREVHVPKLGPNSFSPNAHYVWPKLHRAFQVPVGLPRLQFRRGQR